MKVSELMTKQVKSCLADEDLNRAAQIMWENDCGVLPVVDVTQRVVGMITDRDVCMAAYTRGGPLVSLRVGDAMAKQVISCSLEDSLEAAMSAMRKARVRRLPVVDPLGKLSGILSLNDLAREAARQRKSSGRQHMPVDVAETLGAVCEPTPACPIELEPAALKPGSRAIGQLAGAGA
jgi:CBS domain-containing protein